MVPLWLFLLVCFIAAVGWWQIARMLVFWCYDEIPRWLQRFLCL